jgi:hypothetical protein
VLEREHGDLTTGAMIRGGADDRDDDVTTPPKEVDSD